MAHIAAREMTEAISVVQHAQHLDAQKPHLLAQTVTVSFTQHTSDRSDANQSCTDPTQAVAYVPLLSVYPDATSSIDASTLKIQLTLGVDPASIRNVVLSTTEANDTIDDFSSLVETRNREDEDKEIADALLRMLAIPKHIADCVTAERRRSLLQTNDEAARGHDAAGTNGAKKEGEKAVTGDGREYEKQARSLQRGLSWAKAWLKQRNDKL